jgi:H+/gluconate symporter-like permease
MIKFIIKTVIAAVVGLLVIYGIHSSIVRWRKQKFSGKTELKHAGEAVLETAGFAKTAAVSMGTTVTNALASMRHNALPPRPAPTPLKTNVALSITNATLESTATVDENREQLHRSMKIISRTQCVLGNGR